MSAREEVLGRIRGALADVPEEERPEDVKVARAYRRAGALSRAEVVERFAERVSDYRATVRRVAPEAVGEAVTAACSELGLRRVVVPPALPPAWRPEGIEVIEDDGLAAHALDAIDGAITGCAAAIAETGTLILDGQGVSGRRPLTLVPDHHICVVVAEQLGELVPEALERVGAAVRDERVPITLISGPSATSDIELTRIEGVHGPRHLLVLVVEAPD